MKYSLRVLFCSLGAGLVFCRPGSHHCGPSCGGHGRDCLLQWISLLCPEPSLGLAQAGTYLSGGCRVDFDVFRFAQSMARTARPERNPAVDNHSRRDVFRAGIGRRDAGDTGISASSCLFAYADNHRSVGLASPAGLHVRRSGCGQQEGCEARTGASASRISLPCPSR